MDDLLQNAVIGLFVGSIYALSASGVILTYTTTGVFNLAHFSVVLLAGYLGWQLNGVWGVPLAITVPIVLVVCGPLLGLVLERFIFRPLQARRASGSEKLVAALGLSVVLLALVNVVWGPSVQGTTDQPVPELWPRSSFEIGSVSIAAKELTLVAIVLVVSAALWFLLQRTHLGVQIRAVVDRRELAELAAIDANRVSQVAWSLGCTLAALTGLLFASPALEPYRIIFFALETFSVAVVARLRSIPIAIGFGLLVMGVARAVADGFSPFGTDPTKPAEIYDSVILNLSSILLFVFLVAYRRLDEIGDAGASAQGLVVGAFGRVRRTAASVVPSVVGTALLVLAPVILTGADLRAGHRFLALAVIFVSIVCITGFSGHLTLGQASIAGLGAFFAARTTNAFEVPVLVGMVGGAAVAMFAGLLVGYPALRRKGLFLGLTTLALALVVDRFVFNTEIFRGPPGGLTVTRPVFLGIDLSGDIAFWFYELVVLGIVFFFARNLRSGRLGRVLAAMRDSDTAAASIGIDLRRAKLFVFAVSAAMAGLGGAMLTQADQAWDTTLFNPVFGLFWFVAVVVCGVSSTRGALLAAALYVAFPHITDLDLQSAIGLFGIGAVALGRLPGGVVALGVRIRARVTQSLVEEYRRAKTPVEPMPVPAPSAFADRILAERAES